MTDDKRPGGGGWKIPLLAGLVGILVGAGIMLAANGYFIRSYLLEHPEVLPEAMDRLRARESAQAVDRNREALETPFHGAWAGADDADVVLVEFFDYACSFCRASNSDVERLLREDPRLKVVWREYPVLGPSSEEAAIASLAAAKAGRFRPFHDALFAAGRPTGPSIAAARDAARVPGATLTAEFRAELERNFELGRAIGASGTPTFVIGDQVLQGAVGYEALKEAVEAARQ
ncbi:DsbA family protein [Sphingosinicella sp. CPCC 101087]|uniref:DsbA family protein n=1 Tax=Sphingosinicella sp. CPCC 101087 TaxID=2497754 RepID=UPI00101CEEC0|nr:thioredoxin domain-containing protein [Sphingosinicella sp. CPCC 101087]